MAKYPNHRQCMHIHNLVEYCFVLQLKRSYQNLFKRDTARLISNEEHNECPFLPLTYQVFAKGQIYSENYHYEKIFVKKIT